MVRPLAPAAPGAARNLMVAELFKNATSRSLVRMVSASNLTLQSERHSSAGSCLPVVPSITGCQRGSAPFTEDASVR